MADLNKPLRSSDMDSGSLAVLGDYLARRLDNLRKQNDKHHDPVTTARIRGAIDEVKYLSNLVEPKVIPHASPAGSLDIESLDENAERWLRSGGIPTE
jgi:hypothetical protein